MGGGGARGKEVVRSYDFSTLKHVTSRGIFRGGGGGGKEETRPLERRSSSNNANILGATALPGIRSCTKIDVHIASAQGLNSIERIYPSCKVS